MNINVSLPPIVPNLPQPQTALMGTLNDIRV